MTAADDPCEKCGAPVDDDTEEVYVGDVDMGRNAHLCAACRDRLEALVDRWLDAGGIG